MGLSIRSELSIKHFDNAIKTTTCTSDPPVYPIITTAICNHPSRYALARTNSSTLAPSGNTAPCRTACASNALRRLGNKLGRMAFSAVPTVCGCRDDASTLTKLCTTRRLPGSVSSDAACGRYKRTGRWRRLTPCGFKSFWFMGL
jgi:hypothetical protein